MISFLMTLTTERQTYLLRLRRQGKSLTEISDMLDISISAVSSSLKGAYSKLSMEHEAVEARDLELARLDEVQSSFYETAISGDPKAAEVVFKSMDRRAKLLGLDAPEKKQIETAFTIGWLDDDRPQTIDGESTPISNEVGGDIMSSNSSTENTKKRIAEGTVKITRVFDDD